MSSLDYNTVAAQFDRRYELHGYPGIKDCLLNFVSGCPGARVLEIGCGTGQWLALLSSAGCAVAGIDPSEEMLAVARARVDGDLRRGSAEMLPWSDASFDRVVYVNALHHFANPVRALRQAWRVLSPGGRVLWVGLDPHQRIGRWYVYEHFPAALSADLARFPSCEQRTAWLRAAGFTDVAVRVAEHLEFARSFDQAVAEGILERSFTSQLGLLSAADYATGMQRIRDSVHEDQRFSLVVDLNLYATEACRPA